MPKTLFTVLTLALSTAAFGSADHEHMPPAKTNKSFDQLKQLVGTWEGKTTLGGKEATVTATYELTSGGNAILEKLFPGTPQEMVSVYHPDGNTVLMTHYCMLGNQPQMKLKTSNATTVSFEMTGHTGLHAANEMHMHAMNIKWDSPTAITEEWTSFNAGKKAETAVFNFTKK